MTKSRKVIVAAALLIGGYGVACFLGAPSPRGASVGPPAIAGDGPGVLATLRNYALGHQLETPTGQLVPDTSFVAKVPANSITLVPQQTPQQPTWLVATTPSRPSLPVIEPPKLAESTALVESRPISTTAVKLTDPAAAPAAPKARITNVVSTAAADTNDRAASPWDRWPWWDSNSAATYGASASPPVAGAHYESTGAAATAASFNVSAPTSDSTASDAQPDPYAAGNSPLVSSGRTHVVVDGDSLAKLADRYLDDAELGEEIYRLNQNLLKDPELLPIGVELRIPENRVADSGQRFAGTMGLQATKSGPPAGMVSVEWKPRTFDAEPRAQLLRPIPAGRHD